MASESIKSLNFDTGRDASNNSNNLKASNYNYFFQYNDDTFIGYNFLSRSIIRIPANAFPSIDKFFKGLGLELMHPDTSNNKPQLPTQWLEALRETNFLIDENVNELDIIKLFYNQNLYSNSSLRLTILPTLWCNLTCPYCFEVKKPIFMKPEIEDTIIGWINKNFKDKRYIHNAWFGGEPLLAKKVIFRLTKRLQEFCLSNGTRYDASLTTNGYYLDQEFIDALPSLNIKSIQLTLDGDKDDHDALKKKKNGRGSFDRVFKNVVTFCENEQATSNCHLILRINCSDDNYEGIKKLLERFPPVVRQSASIYFRWIYANEASGYREFSEIRQKHLPFRGLANLYAQARALGWKSAQDPEYSRINCYCEVDYLDQYVIYPDGGVGLCDHLKETELIGRLQEGKDCIIALPNAVSTFAKWYSINPFDDNVCVNCQLLPLCFGGCRKARYEGKRTCMLGREKDTFVRNLIDERLSNEQI